MFKQSICILISLSGILSRTYEFRSPDAVGRQFVFGNPNWFSDVGNLMNNFNNNGYSQWPGLNTQLQNFPNFLANTNYQPNQPEGTNQNQGIFNPFNLNNNNPFQNLFGSNPFFVQPQNGNKDPNVQVPSGQAQNPLLSGNNNPFNLAQQLFPTNPNSNVPAGQNQNPVAFNQNNPLGLLQQQFQQLINNNPFVAPFQPTQQKQPGQNNNKNALPSPASTTTPNRNVGSNNKPVVSNVPVKEMTLSAQQNIKGPVKQGQDTVVPNMPNFQDPAKESAPIASMNPIVAPVKENIPSINTAPIPNTDNEETNANELKTPLTPISPVINKNPENSGIYGPQVDKVSPAQQMPIPNKESENSATFKQPQSTTPMPVHFTTKSTKHPLMLPAPIPSEKEPENIDAKSSGNKPSSSNTNDASNADKVDYSNYDYDAMFNDNKEPRKTGKNTNSEQPTTAGAAPSNPTRSDLFTFPNNNDASANELDARINLVQKPMKSQQ